MPEADEETIQKAFKPNTRCVFGETLANPALAVLDIEKFANIAHKNDVPLIIDNTFATPILCKPIEFGCGYCCSFHLKIYGWTCPSDRRCDRGQW